MGKVFFLSTRFLISRKVNLLLILLIAICIGCLITVNSVAHGFSVVTAKQTKSVYSDICIEIPGQILGVSDFDLLIQSCQKVSGVEAASPYVTGKALFTDTYGQDSVCTIIGLDWALEKKVSELNDKLLGNVKAPECFERKSQRGALIGKPMESIEVGSILTIFAKEGSIPLEINGYFRTGIPSWDYDGIFVSLDTAQNLFGAREYEPAKYKKMATGVRIKVKEGFEINTVRDSLAESMSYMTNGVLKINDYREMNRIEIQAMESYERIINIILTLMLVMITFSIFIPVHSMVHEKSKDIGILKALGGGKLYIFLVFVSIGFMLGILSTILGLPLGFLISHYLNQILLFFDMNPFPPETFYIDELPVIYHSKGIIIIILFVNIIATTASIIPAIRAARLKPIDLLR